MLSALHSHYRHFYQKARFEYRGFDTRASRGLAICDPALPYFIHGAKVILDVFKVDGDREDLRLVAPDLRQQGIDIGQSLASLRADIAVVVVRQLAGQWTTPLWITMLLRRLLLCSRSIAIFSDYLVVVLIRFDAA